MSSKKITDNKAAKRIKRLKPSEFMEVMDRVKMIDEEIKLKTKLYDVKIKSLEFEKEYLLNLADPKKQS